MNGGAAAARFRPGASAPSPKDKRRTWLRWFARSAKVSRSILETTLPPATLEKTVGHTSVASAQDLTVVQAMACVRQSHYGNRATGKESQHLLDVAFHSTPSVQHRRNRRLS